MPTDESSDPAVRKVQRTGGSTFTVSLPKEWARMQDLSAGSTVYVYDFEDRVIVAPTERPDAERLVEVEADGRDSSSITRAVREAYAVGADGVVVTGPAGLDSAERRAATDAITDLVGMRVAEDTDTRVEGRSMLDPSAVSLAQTTAQLRQQVLAMAREAIEALVAGDRDLVAGTRGRRSDVDRFVALIERQFRGALVDVHELDRLGADRAGAYRQVKVAVHLERVARAAERIAAVADDGADPPPAAVGTALETADDRVRTALRAALEGDSREVLEDARQALARLEDALAETAEPRAYRYGRVLGALEEMTDAAAALAAMPD